MINGEKCFYLMRRDHKCMTYAKRCLHWPSDNNRIKRNVLMNHAVANITEFDLIDIIE